MLCLTLVGQCPSGKNAVVITRAGLRFPKKRFVDWRTDALRQINEQLVGQKVDIPFDKPVNVEIDYYPGDNRRRDVPGIIDALWHVLEKAGIVTDDKLLGGQMCHTLFVQSIKNPAPRAEIRIYD